MRHAEEVDTRGRGAAERWTRRAALELAATVAAAAAALALFARFLALVERRPGVVLPDPLLARLPPRDLGGLTFGLLYGGLALAIIALRRRPGRLLRGLRAYVLLLALRALVMAVTPLDPPAGTVPLLDPLVQWLGTGGRPPMRDLFFSGHTATLTLAALAVPGGAARAALAAATAALAACLLAQRVHYTLDVLAAPCFALTAWVLAGALRRRAWRV